MYEIPIKNTTAKVYLRMDGETDANLTLAEKQEGLSPYTRGNHGRQDRTAVYAGSIPVHTGKPLQHMLPLFLLWVYPRTHGETHVMIHDIMSIMGLSPYTRGNHR